jgi:amidase
MKRRDFFRLAAAGGVATLAPGLAAAQRKSGGQSLARAKSARLSLPAVELLHASELRGRMVAGTLTAQAHVRACLEHGQRLDRKGPAFHAVISWNPDAERAARQLDEARRAGRAPGPLHGLAVLVKDNIDTRDQPTTAGSDALAQWRPPRDAPLVERLRAAGAVILGKANLSEWANIRSTKSTSGWSAQGGLTRNPYALDRNACGSSAGSAVGVAAGYCTLAVGTETDGSILAPASYCGVVGLKPTVGLVSRRGVIPIAHSQDTAGPMARTVAEVALLLGVLAGPDPGDPVTAAAAGRALADYTRVLDPQALRGARLGVARKFFGFNDATDEVMEAALRALRAAGAVLVDPADLPSHGKLDAPELEVLLYELKADLGAYLAPLPPDQPVHSLRDLIAFNERHRQREMPYFGQDLFLKAEAKGPLTDKPYREALALCRRLARDEGIDAVVRRHRLDAIVAPTLGGPAHVNDLALGDHVLGGSTTPAAVAGYPAISVPAGEVLGLPVGLSFFGPAWSEPRLLALAFAFEQATKARRIPTFRPTVELA